MKTVSEELYYSPQPLLAKLNRCPDDQTSPPLLLNVEKIETCQILQIDQICHGPPMLDKVSSHPIVSDPIMTRNASTQVITKVLGTVGVCFSSLLGKPPRLNEAFLTECL